MENQDYLQDRAFQDWLAANTQTSILGLEDDIRHNNTSRLDDLVEKFTQAKEQEEKAKEQEERDFVTFSQGKPAEGNQPVKEDNDNYYKVWCEQEHQPPFVYENTNEQSPAYGMKYYKSAEDKAAGKYAARALYSDNKHVEVECPDDKGPDYEFLDALVRKAALDGQPGIHFDAEMTPEFANKLAAACVKYGLKMKGQPEKIDVSEFADQLTPEQKANIDKYNQGEKPYLSDYDKKLAITKDYAARRDVKDIVNEADVSKYKNQGEQAAWFAALKEAGITPQKENPFYKLNDDKVRNLPESARSHLKAHNAETVSKLYERAKQQAVAYQQENPGKDFDLSQSKAKDSKSAALLYAAYTAAGIKVSGMDEVNKETQGLFQTETLGFMPDEAQKIVTDYNYGVRKQQFADKTRQQDSEYQSAIMAANPTAEQLEIIARHDERRRAQEARSRIGLARQSGTEASKDDKARVTGAGRKAALKKEIERRLGGR